MINQRGKQCCDASVIDESLPEEYRELACLREKGHRGEHESLMWRATEMDAFDRGADKMRKKISEWMSNRPCTINEIPYPEDE